MTKEELTTCLTAARDLEVQRLGCILFRYAREMPFDAYRRDRAREVMGEMEAFRAMSIDALADALLEAVK